MQKAVVLDDLKLCTGCRICENVCSIRFEKKFNPRRSRIQVVKLYPGLIDIPVVCAQCVNPPCLKACPTSAIRKDEVTKTVLVDEEKCIGCGKCVEVCPRGAITIHPERGVAIKCDLCNGDPLCVKYCPTHAILFTSINIIAQKKRIEVAKSAGAELASLLKRE